MSPTIAEIIAEIERVAPLRLQENYDNCGLLVGKPDTRCTGAILCLDVTPDIVDEAVMTGSNLIIAHHPIIFKPLKALRGESLVEQTVINAIRNNISIYASHTAMDNAPGGVSAKMAKMLGLNNCHILAPIQQTPESGSGVLGELPIAMDVRQFVDFVKQTFSAQVARCSRFDDKIKISKVAVCGGSGAFLIPDAVAAQADAIITADIKYHDFADCNHSIVLIDIGHFETEQCITSIFYDIISKKFSNFALRYAEKALNPVIYL